MKNYQQYIRLSANVRFGKPCVIGTRITVYDVLTWLASGMSVEDIQADFPELGKEHILACLAYAADKEHKIRIAV
jgi:uncharacterized protein (DUF433 family)